MSLNGQLGAKYWSQDLSQCRSVRFIIFFLCHIMFVKRLFQFHSKCWIYTFERDEINLSEGARMCVMSRSLWFIFLISTGIFLQGILWNWPFCQNDSFKYFWICLSTDTHTSRLGFSKPTQCLGWESACSHHYIRVSAEVRNPQTPWSAIIQIFSLPCHPSPTLLSWGVPVTLLQLLNNVEGKRHILRIFVP